MPRRKKLPELSVDPDLSGLGRTDKDPQNWVVQKSNPLQTLSETDMTLPEFKILDAYLSRIDSHNPEGRYIRFEKGELEKLLGVEKINKQDLDKRLRSLFQTLEIHDERKPKGFTLIALFEKAEAFQDEDELWQVDLACTQSAMEYVFNIENIGYLQYRLKNVINLTSRYSYILFLYLLENRWRKSWKITLLELKRLLNCTADTYDEFKRFNDLILKKCCKEINEKTDLRFTYEPTDRRNRRYTKVEFNVETLADTITDVDPNQLSFDDFVLNNNDDDKWIKLYGSEQLAELAGACNYEFGKEDMEEISRILIRIDIPKDPRTDSLEWGKVFYLKEKYAALGAEAAKKERNGEKPIKSRVKYFKGMLEKDAFQPVAYKD